MESRISEMKSTVTTVSNFNNSHCEQKDESFNFSLAECSFLLFAPREKWKEDSEVTHCFNCNSQFFFLLRRKHHCRKCGNIFCGNCSNFFLNTEEIGIKSTEKIARLCGYCFQGTQNYLNLMRRENMLRKSVLNKDKAPPDTISENDDTYNDSSNEEELHNEYSPGDFEERQKMLLEKLSCIIDLMAVKIPSFQDLEFKSKLMKILANSLLLIHLDNINRNDYMDICHYIKIKKIKIVGLEKPNVEYIQGIICRKNVHDRKMQSFFENPNILIISPSIDLPTLTEKKEHDGPVQMDLLLQNEKKMIKKTVENLLKFKPNVIFVENSVNRIASDLLKSQGITLFIKVKGQLLKRIARMTKAKILKSLKHLHKMNGKNILGNCEKLYTKKFCSEDQTKDPTTLLYLEGCSAEAGSTISLSGANIDELISIKKAIKILLRLGRHIDLEHEVVFIEQKMREELKRLCPNDSLSFDLVTKTMEPPFLKPFETFYLGNRLSEKKILDKNKESEVWVIEAKEGDLSEFLDKKLGMIRFLKRDYIHYTKIHLVRAIIENHIDIKDNIHALQELNAKDFFELCGSPSINKICYYSPDDITLGNFILNKVKNLFTRCEREGCNRPRNNHIALYYQGNRYVKITVEITGFIRGAALNSDGKFVYLEEHKSDKSVIERLSSSNSGKFDGNFNIKPELPINLFKTYLTCEMCGVKLTEEKQLEKPYLEYSFTRFLSHFFVGTEKILKASTKDDDVSDQTRPNLKKCGHFSKKRVFQYGEFLINFSSGFLKCYSLEIRKIGSKQTIDQMQDASMIVLNDKKVQYLKQFKEIIMNLINILKDSIKDLKQEDYDLPLSLEKVKSSLESLLNTIQFFALSCETTLNSPFNSYLELEYQRIQLATQFSNFLEIFFQFFQKKLDNAIKIDNFSQTIMQLSPQNNISQTLTLSIFTKQGNNDKYKDRTLSPKLRSTHPLFKRSLSSNKDFTLEKENSAMVEYLARKKDLRFSSNPKVRNNGGLETEKLEKLCFLKKQLSRFSDKNERFSADKPEKTDLCETSEKLDKLEKSEKNEKIEKFRKGKFYEKSNKNSGQTDINLDLTDGCSGRDKISENSNSEKEDYIDEGIDENPFELTEESNRHETSPNEDHENEIQSPQIFEPEDIPVKKLGNTNNFSDLFNELRSLNGGQSLSCFSAENAQNHPLSYILNFQKYKYIPLYENEPITAIVHALNSLEYLKDVYMDGGFHKYEQGINILRISKETASSFKKLIKNHLEKSVKKLQVPSHFIYRTMIVKTFLLRSELMKTSEESPKPELSVSNLGGEYNQNVRKNKLINVSILIYYAKQFEAIRMDNGILLSSFLKSLGCSSQWQENSGGKSKASFIKSYDNLYIFKELEKKEFSMFFNYAHSYFDYIWKSSNKKKPSVLTKIYGLFEVKIKNSRYYYIAMENLFFGIDPNKELKIYDLKGSDTNRYNEKKRKNQTLLDTNYKIEQNGEPLALKAADKKFLDIAFENDSKFLKKHNLVDYSLLLIMDQEKNIVKMGIIDYLREYTWDKKVETVAKKITKGGATPTIVSPSDYRDRFKKAMSKYFMEVSGL